MDEFLLHSGERQVGTNLKYIRPDHLARYKVIADTLNRVYIGDTSRLNGVDVFCGNGYGTYLLSTELKCTVTGIDASDEAINQAHHHYTNDYTFFSIKAFPFVLPYQSYDFVVSIESIEHVMDNTLLVENLVGAVKPGGYFFASIPNQNSLSLDKNPNKFHHRHFTYMEFLNLVKSNGDIELETFYGQDAYTMKDGVVSGYLKQNEMGLRHRYQHGQFLYFIFKKCNV